MATRPYYKTVLELLRRVSSREELRHISRLLIDTEIPFKPDAISVIIEEFQRQAAALGLEDTLGVVAALRARAIQIHLLVTGWPNPDLHPDDAEFYLSGSNSATFTEDLKNACLVPGISSRGVVVDLGNPKPENFPLDVVVDVSVGENAGQIIENFIRERIVETARQNLTAPESSREGKWSILVLFHYNQ